MKMMAGWTCKKMKKEQNGLNSNVKEINSLKKERYKILYIINYYLYKLFLYRYILCISRNVQIMILIMMICKTVKYLNPD